MRFVLMNNGAWYCYSDDESPDHEEELKGTIQKADDDFWRFYGSSLTVLICKDCRMLAEKLSALNGAPNVPGKGLAATNANQGDEL